MIGDKIDKEDPYWQNFLLHLQFNDYIFAPTNMAAHLPYLIVDHHKTFKELYKCSIIPKMHYMVHYPEWMSRYTIMLVLLDVYMYYNIRVSVHVCLCTGMDHW